MISGIDRSGIGTHRWKNIMSAEAKPLSKKTKIFYGIGDLGNATVNSAIQFFLMKFYTDGALVSPALAGNALLIGKICDAINDPLFGWFTDRTESRYGKRRVFMIQLWMQGCPGPVVSMICLSLLRR